MRNVLLLTALSMLPFVAYAGESVQSPDVLESELTTCLMKNAKQQKCMEDILGKRILPGNDHLISVSTQMDQLLKKGLDKESIYAIHPVRTKKTGDLYENRSYFIEDSSGALMTFNLSVLKRLGKWYVLQFNLSSTTEKVNALLYGE